MRTGSRCGNRRRQRGRCGGGILPFFGKKLGIDLFIEDGAYTTVASACAMLMVLALLFSSSLAIWSASRAGDVQVSADATALAGENVVSSYCTAATVLDACVLSLGLAGFTMAGAGMVGLFVPGGQGLARETLDIAVRVFDMRNSFASSTSSGLKRVEGSLPFLIAANATRACDVQGSEVVGYHGTAFAVPAASASEFPALEGEGIETEGLEQACDGLEEASAELERISEEVAARREEAWLADCGAPGRNMQERAARLSGVSAVENPDFASSITWDPEFALERARAYYRWRCDNDKPEGSNVEARADAAARRAFYRYALEHLEDARVVDDGEKACTTLEFLPRNSDEVRQTSLYTEEVWPTSMEASGLTLHFDGSCPGVRGVPGALASLASLDGGSTLECPTCRFGVDDLGRAPAASTSIDNGFEYHLRAFTKALREYLEARGRQNDAEAAARGDAERAADAFDQAIATLGGKRPRIAPPGRFGCVSFVASSEYSTPDALETSFAVGSDMSRRGAIAAAVLAPDGLSEGDDALSGFFSSLQERIGSDGLVGLLDGVLDLWGKLLVSYGDAGQGLEGAFDDFMRSLDGQGLGSVGEWLGDRLTGVVRALDMQPVDMRPRKPVLVNSADVLARSDVPALVDTQAALRELAKIDLDFEDMARAVGYDLGERLTSLEIVLAELQLPNGRTVPITLRVRDLLGGREMGDAGT